jgi:hypothetical protein
MAWERQARYRARKRGEKIPLLKGGRKPGFKQSPESIEKRKRWGPDHHAWKGDSATPSSARERARTRFAAKICSKCGSRKKVERHHIDSNPFNNEPENIAVLCRRCHMDSDGRMEAIRKRTPENLLKAITVRKRSKGLPGPRKRHCKRGHPLIEENIVFTNKGKVRRCKICYEIVCKRDALKKRERRKQ